MPVPRKVFLNWYEHAENDLPDLTQIDRMAVRVVHGGREFDSPALIDQTVEKKIIDFERLAPLHNKSAIEILAPLQRKLPEVSIYGVFDTAFHRTIPEYVSRYALAPEMADKHHILRYGFHGISHRYLLERCAHLTGKMPAACNVVSLHLESGCSVTAVREGKSIDNYDGSDSPRGIDDGNPIGRCGSLPDSIADA